MATQGDRGEVTVRSGEVARSLARRVHPEPGTSVRVPVSRIRVQFRRALIPATSVLSVFALWELITVTQLIPTHFFPTMTGTLAELARQFVSASFWAATGDTMAGWALGLGIATIAAVPLGIVIGSSRLMYRALGGTIEFLRPIPSVALIPLAVLLYGTGMDSKVFLVAFASFWPLLIQTIYGVQDVDPVARDTARSYGYSGTGLLLRVTLPSAVPYIATGLRISTAIALILAVTAELVIGSPGLGYAIELAHSGGAIAQMYALIIATGLLGWGSNSAFVAVEKKVLHWHPSHRVREAI